jgi:TPR repeat protein
MDKSSFTDILKAAEQGLTFAQNRVGWLYQKGIGIPRDDAKAEKWYRRAAQRGYAQAQFNLGWMYEKGEGVSQDSAEAAKWYRKAAEQGEEIVAQLKLDKMSSTSLTDEDIIKTAKQGMRFAQNRLGWMYQHGIGVHQNDAEAVKWYQKAAEKGYAQAQLHLGLMYENGKGVPRDSAEAAKWFRKAAEQSDEILAPSRREKPDSSSITDILKAAQHGLTFAQNSLGWLYQKGIGIPRDEAKALKWYKKAADKGFAEAQFNLGSMYENGKGVPRDDVEAAKWYRKAAEQGEEIKAQSTLDKIKEASLANTDIIRVAEQGLTFAQNRLGWMYQSGQGVPQSDIEALKWYRKAAEKGYAQAQFNLGRMYEKGTGVPRDEAEAAKWYRKAAQQSEAVTKSILGKVKVE